MGKEGRFILALAGLGLLGLAVSALPRSGTSQDWILADSRISVIHSSHRGITVFLMRIDGRERAVERITYAASARDGKVAAEVVYRLDDDKGASIVKERRRSAEGYVRLWRDLLAEGLEDLAALPLDEPVDPFEFRDSWNIDQDRIDMEFRLEGRVIAFHLYDPGSFRDPRFAEIAGSVMDFLDKDDEPR
ncbi:MAG: hypothetical protein MUE80_02825 [Acidobacteria bacterium]|jgi:hypothetical protein|nr:hypothetical protein [Acidobacteriota bacterium]